MRRKSIILGLVLFLAGVAALGWSLKEKRKEQQEASSYKLKNVTELDEYLNQYNKWLQSAPEKRSELPWGVDKYGKTKPPDQLQHEQQERLKADLDRLAADETDVYPFADILYGENWREELDEYKARKEKRELVLTGSILCTLAGGSILSWWLLLWTGRLVIKVFFNSKKFATNFLRRCIKTKIKQPAEPKGKGVAKTSEQKQKLYKPQIQLKKKPTVRKESGRHDSEGPPKQNKVGYETALAENNKMAPKADTPVLGTQKVTASRLSGSTVKPKKPLKNATEGLNLNTMQANRPAQSVRETTPQHSQEETMENSQELEASFRAQTENLEKQMAEFRQMAQTVQQTAIEHSRPLNSTLKDLNQQVAAIREYASQQQDRVEKLQDGYDWNIVRTFCMRVIRCIDNLENRIKQLTKQGVETINLEEAKDELVFALESSGVEQFEPEINSYYRGQEKFAEVVKERESSDDSKMTGKIAKVVRPGYQYIINEEIVKVVRTAQVKLFG
jgi:molecular chaperone GrpE (heat shock protein)